MSLHRLSRATLALACVLSFAAFAAFGVLVLSASPSSASERSAIGVRLVDFRVVPAARSVRRGRVTFSVSNRAMDAHELVVIRTKRPAARLAVSGSRASEAGKIGESGEIRTGASRRFTLTLRPGHYALICNEPGHYRLGMHADFTVR